MRIKGIKPAINQMERRHRDFAMVGGSIDKRLGSIVSTSIKRNISAGGRPERWPKRTRTYPWPILNKTGLMHKTAESTALVWRKEGSWHVNNIMGPKYGRYHQYVTESGPPVREYILLQSSEIQAMFKVFEMAFRRKL